MCIAQRPISMQMKTMCSCICSTAALRAVIDPKWKVPSIFWATWLSLERSVSSSFGRVGFFGVSEQCIPGGLITVVGQKCRVVQSSTSNDGTDAGGPYMRHQLWFQSRIRSGQIWARRGRAAAGPVAIDGIVRCRHGVCFARLVFSWHVHVHDATCASQPLMCIPKLSLRVSWMLQS